MKKIIVVTMMLLLSLGLGASGAWAVDLNFPDVDPNAHWVNVWRGTQGALGAWQDVVGADDPNQTFGARYDTVSHHLTFYTNWSQGRTLSGSGQPTFVTAMLFLDTSNDNNPATWNKAINIDNTLGAYTIYSSPLTITTSQQVITNYGAATNVLFGGLWTTNGNSTAGPPSNPVPVQATSANTSGPATVVWSANVANPFAAGFCNTVDIDLTFLGVGAFDFLWGTATCANDVVYGQVPLPPSVLLLGSGLLGLGALRWRRRS